MKLKIPPILLLIFAIGLMWMIDQYLHVDALIFVRLYYVSIGFFAVGVLWVILGLREFDRLSTTSNPRNIEKASALVTTGIYRISRNPMYVGLACILVAAAFYLDNLLTLLVVPLFVWYMNRYQIKPEEQVMEEKFGDEFREYKSKVRRWI